MRHDRSFCFTDICRSNALRTVLDAFSVTSLSEAVCLDEMEYAVVDVVGGTPSPGFSKIFFLLDLRREWR